MSGGFSQDIYGIRQGNCIDFELLIIFRTPDNKNFIAPVVSNHLFNQFIISAKNKTILKRFLMFALSTVL
jgi:hypothetical protein